MKVASVRHQAPSSGLVHAFIRSGKNRARAACGATRIDWPIEHPVTDEGRWCNRCTSTLANIEAKLTHVLAQVAELTAQSSARPKDDDEAC
jgi:hypothetical protein